MEPLVEQQKRDGDGADEREHANPSRMKPVDAVALEKQGGEGSEADGDQQRSAPVELRDALVLGRFGGHAVPHQEECKGIERQSLVKNKAPPDQVGP